MRWRISITQGIQKGTFNKKKAKPDLIYLNKVERRQIQNLFTSAEISGDVIRRGRIFAKLRTLKDRLYAEWRHSH